jgi:3-deoxy-D-manno-octulosonic-acid transferase
MCQLGVDQEKTHTLGNLKFDTILSLRQQHDETITAIKEQLPGERLVLLGGSTHPGEEELLLRCFKEIRKEFPHLLLLLAPRDASRVVELVELVAHHELSCQLRSAADPCDQNCEVFLLDSIGELAACYSLGDICYVGGSLVRKGGHNPIEPAAMEKPVLFGPHMEDFSEIAAGLTAVGGAVEVRTLQDLIDTIGALAKNEQQRLAMGKAARSYVEQQQGVIKRHLQLIHSYLCVE